MTKMESDQSTKSAIENIWKFIRGDMSTSDFEDWVYSDPALKNSLGKTLHLEIISANFSSKEVVLRLKDVLKKFAVSSNSSSCFCVQLSNIAVVDMGDESKKVFTTLDRIKKRGEPFWWLSVYQCHECQQFWLVAHEEKQNDVIYLYRLDTVSAQDILSNNNWVPIFDDYEDLLCRVSKQAKVFTI